MGYTVLVAEDEPLIMESIVRHIETADQGFAVVGAVNNGEKAWELIQQQIPHILFSDIQMPVMSGLELLKKTGEEYPDILKVVISGYADFEYARKAIDYGVQEYMLKPILHEDMVKTLHKLRVKLDSQQRLIEDRLPDTKKNDYQVEKAAAIMESYIREHYMEDINLDLLARNLRFNLSYLGRAFAARTGKSPSKYLTSVRINKAKQLLKYNETLSIQEVGTLCGYPNPAYFSRIFKNITGYSPLHVRDEQKNRESNHQLSGEQKDEDD